MYNCRYILLRTFPEFCSAFHKKKSEIAYFSKIHTYKVNLIYLYPCKKGSIVGKFYCELLRSSALPFQKFWWSKKNSMLIRRTSAILPIREFCVNELNCNNVSYTLEQIHNWSFRLCICIAFKVSIKIWYRTYMHNSLWLKGPRFNSSIGHVNA